MRSKPRSHRERRAAAIVRRAVRLDLRDPPGDGRPRQRSRTLPMLTVSDGERLRPIRRHRRVLRRERTHALRHQRRRGRSARASASARGCSGSRRSYGTTMFNSSARWFRRQSVARKLTTIGADHERRHAAGRRARCSPSTTTSTSAVPPGPRRHDARRHRRQQQHGGAHVQGRGRGRGHAARHRASTSTFSTRGCSRATASLLATYARPSCDGGTPVPDHAGTPARRCDARSFEGGPSARRAADRALSDEVIGSIAVESDTDGDLDPAGALRGHRRGDAVRRVLDRLRPVAG